jgi:capsid protein
LKDHPGNQYALQNHFATVRVPASHVIHYFEPDRAEQTRGVSGLTAALPLLADLRDLITWELIAVKMAACFGVHVEGGSINPLQNQANTTNGGPLTDAYGNPVTQLQPGLLTMGQGKLTQLQGARPGGTFLPFFQSLLRFACAGADMGFSTVGQGLHGWIVQQPSTGGAGRSPRLSRHPGAACPASMHSDLEALRASMRAQRSD